MVNQAELQRYQRDPFWKFGVLVPQTHAHAIDLDKQTSNISWKKMEATEMGQLKEYETFVDIGIAWNIPSGFKIIHCHMRYDVKHDGRHKAQLFAGGNLRSEYGMCMFRCCIGARYLVDCILS
jgi:hypothetical protein